MLFLSMPPCPFPNCIDTLDEHELLLLLTAHSEGVINHRRLKELLSMHPSDITKMLQKLRRDGLLVAEGRGQGCIYRLKDASSEGQMMQATPLNDASSEGQMMQANAPNDASSEGQMMQALPRKLSAEDMKDMICLFCSEWRTVQEIATHVLRTKSHIRNVVLPRLLKTDALEQRFSAKRHPNQQYRVRREE